MKSVFVSIIGVLFILPAFSQEVPPREPAQQMDSSFHNDQLRRRDHNISFRWGSSTDKIDKLKMTNSNFEIGYNFNLGFVEPGVSIARRHMSVDTPDGDDPEQSVETALLNAKINIIENRPGNDFIPFIKIGFGRYSLNIDGEDSYDLDGTYTLFSVGFDWYPLGQFLAFRGELIEGNGEIKISDGSNSVGGVDYGIRGLNAGLVFSF